MNGYCQVHIKTLPNGGIEIIARMQSTEFAHGDEECNRLEALIVEMLGYATIRDKAECFLTDMNGGNKVDLSNDIRAAQDKMRASLKGQNN
jgi:hypothetical protein